MLFNGGWVYRVHLAQAAVCGFGVMPIISLEGVSKKYLIFPRRRDRLKEALGLGKIKLLKIISRVLQPTTGEIKVNGRLAALLQLGAGFDLEFTGRENVLLNGLILGMERRKMLERFDEIATFADIGEFMDQPVKTYSSGMRARLGFAVGGHVAPEI